MKDDHDIKVGSGNFERSNVHPELLQTAHQAWVSLTTTCKGVAFDIVHETESRT